MSLGKSIRGFRKQRGMVLQDLADKLEVSCSYLSAIEREVKKPSIAMLKKITDVLNISPTYLFEAEKIYGEKIRFIRRGRSLSIEEFSELSGIPAELLVDYEEGKKEPDLETLDKIAGLLGVTIRYFLEKNAGSTSIGERVRKEREKIGITGTSLADKSGISPAMVSQVENDQAEPSLDTLENIAKALNVSVCYFLLEQEDVQDLVASLNSEVLTLLGDPRVQSVLRAVRDLEAGDLKFILNYIQFYKRNKSLLIGTSQGNEIVQL